MHANRHVRPSEEWNVDRSLRERFLLRTAGDYLAAGCFSAGGFSRLSVKSYGVDVSEVIFQISFHDLLKMLPRNAAILRGMGHVSAVRRQFPLDVPDGKLLQELLFCL